MTWDLHSAGIELEDGIREHIDRRLAFAVSRFGSRVLKTSVFLSDTNGPKGGVDKSCLIIVKLRGAGEVVAEVVDSEWNIAVDRATSRLGHNISRELERRREIDRHHVSRH